MDVMTAACKVGITASDGSAARGTIDEDVVLAVLLDMEFEDAQNADLYTEAAVRVRQSRSGGVERIEAGSIFARQGRARNIVLRYRSEVADIFLDLAIDVGMRQTQPELAENTTV